MQAHKQLWFLRTDRSVGGGIGGGIGAHPPAFDVRIAFLGHAKNVGQHGLVFGIDADDDFTAFFQHAHGLVQKRFQNGPALGREAGVFGGHVDFHRPERYWDFKSVGRGDIRFERVIRALNDIGYAGPLSVEWEDGGMDREYGAAESCAFVRRLDFPPSKIVFDAQFAGKDGEA